LNSYLSLTFFAVIFFIPKLIAQDLSSHAFVIYNSKALTRYDYLLGKFGVVFGILALLWLLPLVASWAVGNLMAPRWSFFVHSLPALGIALGAGLFGVTVLSLIALAISALAKRSSVAVAVWAVGWIAASIFAGAVGQLHHWGEYLSPGQCIARMGGSLFDLPGVYEKAKTMLPLFNFFVDSTGPGKADIPSDWFQIGTVWEPALFLIGYGVLSVAILAKRVKPE